MTKRRRNSSKKHKCITNGYNPSGRSGMFSEDMLPKIEMLSQLGATNKQIAGFFDIKQDTFENWQRKYPKVKEAKKQGGIQADMKVASSLYKRAIGFKYLEEEWIEEGIRDKDGVMIEDLKRIRRRVTEKHVIPDVKAATHWLRNRQRDIWTEAPYRVENYIKGRIDHQINPLPVSDVEIKMLPIEAQDALFELGIMQLKKGQRNN